MGRQRFWWRKSNSNSNSLWLTCVITTANRTGLLKFLNAVVVVVVVVVVVAIAVAIAIADVLILEIGHFGQRRSATTITGRASIADVVSRGVTLATANAIANATANATRLVLSCLFLFYSSHLETFG